MGSLVNWRHTHAVSNFIGFDSLLANLRDFWNFDGRWLLIGRGL